MCLCIQVWARPCQCLTCLDSAGTRASAVVCAGWKSWSTGHTSTGASRWTRSSAGWWRWGWPAPAGSWSPFDCSPSQPSSPCPWERSPAGRGSEGRPWSAAGPRRIPPSHPYWRAGDSPAGTWPRWQWLGRLLWEQTRGAHRP